MDSQSKKVWYITGATSGTGLALCESLLEKGYCVTGTTRDLSKISKISIFNHQNFLGLEVDLVDEKCVNDSIKKTIERFGTLTHVVNNAGCLHVGTAEEVSLKESKELFGVLYFGPTNVIRACLPHMRSKKNGYIFNVTSIAGYSAFPYLSTYSAAKHALVGYTNSLKTELLGFNIKVSSIGLGYFKTGLSTHDAYDSFVKNFIPEYETINNWKVVSEQGLILKPGDTKKYAEIVIKYGSKNELPTDLFISGGDIIQMVEGRIEQIKKEILDQMDNRDIY